MNLLMFYSFALAIRENGTYAPFSSESWSFAGQVTLLGMGMIFAVLGILWGVLAIFKLIFAGKSTQAAKQSKSMKKQPVKAAEQTQSKKEDVAVNAPKNEAATSDETLIAILTAAVTAYREEEGTSTEFRVVSFKRTSARAWNAKK